MECIGDRTIYQEKKVDITLENCKYDVLVKMAGGLLLGCMISTIFARSPAACKWIRPTWPFAVGPGIGLGMALENCKRELNKLYTPVKEAQVVPIIPNNNKKQPTCTLNNYIQRDYKAV